MVEQTDPWPQDLEIAVHPKLENLAWSGASDSLDGGEATRERGRSVWAGGLGASRFRIKDNEKRVKRRGIGEISCLGARRRPCSFRMGLPSSRVKTEFEWSRVRGSIGRADPWVVVIGD